MTIEELIERLRAQINGRVARYNELSEAVNAVRAAETPDQAREDELMAQRAPVAAEIEELRRRLEQLQREAEQDAAIARLQSESNPVGQRADTGEARETASGVQTREPRTYSADSSRQGRSFFMDAYRAEYSNDFRARERLERHMVEVEREGELSERAQTTGGSSSLVIPQYLLDQAALVARAGRPVANAIQSLPLPATGMSLIIPRGTTGAAVASQANENTAVQNTDQVFANLTVPVVTIAGQQDVSRQLLERGSAGVDQIIYNDLAGAYAAELDRQVVNGSGAANQMLGILQTAGATQMSAFTAAATAQTFWLKFSGAKAAIAANRFLAATLAFMHPNRWGWLEGLLDGQNRPLVLPNVNGPTNTYGVYSDETYGMVAGSIGSLPVVTDANVPTNVGTGPEDVVGVVRKEDLLLWEDGNGMPTELRFEQTLGNQLTTKLVVYGYAAFTAGRYPASVAKVGGNSAAGFGLIAPTF